MRIAATLAIFARCINLHLFVPTYVPDDDDIVRPLLLRLAMADSKRESFSRSVLLSMFPEEQAKNGLEAVSQVVKEVIHYVRDLLSEGQCERLRSGLEPVARQAYQIWKGIQLAQDKFEPLFTLENFDDMEWQQLKFDTDTPPTDKGKVKSTAGVDGAHFVIFPRIYFVDNSEPEPITQGVALMRSQLIAATEEVEKNISSSPIIGRSGARTKAGRSRAQSVSLNGTSSFLPQRAVSSIQ